MTVILVLGVSLLIFLVGIVVRMVRWAKAPVPFRIPTTAGQQRSLPWIKPARLDNPSTTIGTIGRMALEILLFRSLLRGTAGPADLRRLESGADREQPVLLPDGRNIPRVQLTPLWAGAIVFHYSLLVILLRHLRFFFEPVPAFVTWLSKVDGFFQVGTPPIYLTDVTFAIALGYLLVRRLADARLRYFSLASDYVAPALLLSAAGSGMLMRYVARQDIVSIKQITLGLVTASPDSAAFAAAGTLLVVHLLLVSVLLAYFPFSKLVHMAGIFLSPTRNLANNNRARRHVNEWNYPVKVHTYEEWEDEFRDKMRAAGLPLEAGKHV